MTGFKHILANLSDPQSSAAVLELAILLGRDHEAHVAALHIRPDLANAIPLVGEGMSSSMVEEMLNAAEERATERAKQIKAQFDDARHRHNISIPKGPGAAGFSAMWHEEVGQEEDVLANAARLTDLVVVGRPSPDDDSPSISAINAALLEGGRPVLLAPPTAPVVIGRNIAIFWNGSAEVSHAVAAALPLLRRADKVSILSARENDLASPDDLSAYLAWHGISASIRTVSSGGNVGERLLAEADSVGADLVVMGAYTHSRLRQLILGGVTHYMLYSAKLPIFLSH